MKKLLALIIAVLLIFPVFAGCASKESKKVLRICNCEDYIDEELLSEFEEAFDCKIEYSTFGTLENLYNDIKITPDRYDLICPSDYMIEKMAKEGMLQKIGDKLTEDGNYHTYVSSYIDDTFSSITWNNGEDSLADYAVCYMWGTLGLTFNSEFVDEADMESWASLWDKKYANKSTIKDSIRDSFFMGAAYANKEELDDLSEKFNGGEIDLDNYQSELLRIFNDTSEENVLRVEEGLKNLKGNIYGFEVDSGKNDVASGKITINFAWSGDAVYAMDQAEEVGAYLNYTVPNEGSNVWFDGWCVPKNAKNVDLAIEFIEFLSDPEIVLRNMEYIGYTSGIAGEDVFGNAIDWYGVCTLVETDYTEDYYNSLSEEEQEYYELDKDGKVWEYVYVEDSEVTTITGDDETGYTANLMVFNEDTEEVEEEETEIYKVDLSYFFGEDDEWVIYTDTIGRQFTAQYPTEDIINRCVVMNCYDDEANTRVTLMWERVKGFTLPLWAIILIVIGICGLIAFGIIYKYKEKIFAKVDLSNKEPRRRKKYKVVKKERIK